MKYIAVPKKKIKIQYYRMTSIQSLSIVIFRLLFALSLSTLNLVVKCGFQLRRQSWIRLCTVKCVKLHDEKFHTYQSYSTQRIPGINSKMSFQVTPTVNYLSKYWLVELRPITTDPTLRASICRGTSVLPAGNVTSSSGVTVASFPWLLSMRSPM